ncbi:MAG: hypothetical protein KKE29_21445 [Proteobacteria bacterium]|nr:hypothetical protein [Pseudomonadota bacterium]MBU4577160.1 hypothetical protein [Pseudomonadota bacterium]MBU4599138.1 hypothetical protein [Pseudomonadota bacterium]
MSLQKKLARLSDLETPDLERLQLAGGLGAYPCLEVLEQLTETSLTDPHGSVRSQALKSLARMSLEFAVQQYARRLHLDNPSMVDATIMALFQLAQEGHSRAVIADLLLPLCSHEDCKVASNAANAIKGITGQEPLAADTPKVRPWRRPLPPPDPKSPWGSLAWERPGPSAHQRKAPGPSREFTVIGRPPAFI